MEGRAGETVLVPVGFVAGTSAATGLSIDIFGDPIFDANASNRPDCTLSPPVAAVKDDSGFGFRPFGCDIEETCTEVRAGIISFDVVNNGVPVPEGLIYSCAFTIPITAHIGDEFTFDVDRASYIVPSGDETDITAASSGGLVRVVARPDPFKCYKVKDLKEPKFAQTTVELADQFGVTDGNFDVTAPFLLCNPAEVDGVGIFDEIDHLSCYKIKGPKLERADRPRFEVENHFGQFQLEAKKPFLLCLPSSKTLLP